MNKTYKIKSGDNLSKVAKQFGISLEQLLELNLKFKANPNKISVGDVVVVSIEEEVKPEPQPQPETVEPEKSNIELGSLSAKYEVGNRGPGTVSTGIGDAGGVSYGSYQMTSKPNGGTVKRFVSQEGFPFIEQFRNLQPGGEQFTRVWRTIAITEPQQFQNVQHEFIKMTHFDPLVSKIKSQKGLDMTNLSDAVQNVVWSTAVQHGPGSSIIQTAISNLGNLSQEDSDFNRKLIKAVYAERGRKNNNGVLVYFSRNSANVQKGVANRFINEEKDALKMLDG